MKLSFTKAVRESMAVEFKKLSWLGSAAFTAAGLIEKNGWILLALVFWWLLFQALAHVLIALEDRDTS